MRKKRLLGWLLIAGAATGAVSLAPTAPSPAPEPAAPMQLASEPASRGLALPQRDTLGEGRGAVFAARSWAPPPRPATAPAALPSPPPAPPPMPYRVAGELVQGKHARVVLAKGDAVLIVREGQSLEGGYRVESIDAHGVTLVYLPLGVREILPVASSLSVAAGSRPAHASWEGPERVRKGDLFEVALKVTSQQSLDALPLQLAFDAKLLELVAVRSGGFFGAKGKFSYRVSPEGHVSIGASGPGRVASDAQLVVFTFKPIRPAIAAELQLSSAVLQGSAYRTAIMP